MFIHRAKELAVILTFLLFCIYQFTKEDNESVVEYSPSIRLIPSSKTIPTTKEKLQEELKTFEGKSIFEATTAEFKIRYGPPSQITHRGEWSYYYYPKAHTTLQINLAEKRIYNVYAFKVP